MRDAEGDTPLHVAAREGQEAAVRELLAARAAVNAPGAGGCTPLHLAAQVRGLGACCMGCRRAAL